MFWSLIEAAGCGDEKNVVYVSKDWCSQSGRGDGPYLVGDLTAGTAAAAPSSGRHHFLTECKLPAHSRIHHCQVQ